MPSTSNMQMVLGSFRWAKGVTPGGKMVAEAGWGADMFYGA